MRGGRGATFYFEFLGPSSFAGSHYPEPHRVVLLDIEPHKQDILSPRDFLGLCKKHSMNHPTLLHVGNFTKDLSESVSDGTLEGMTFEGVVVKGTHGRFKWKNRLWLSKLKGFCGDDEALFRRLS